MKNGDPWEMRNKMSPMIPSLREFQAIARREGTRQNLGISTNKGDANESLGKPKTAQNSRDQRTAQKKELWRTAKGLDYLAEY